MASKRGFLVARSVDTRWQLVSKSGYLLAGVGACHPVVGDMTETAHEQICRAVSWMADEPAANFVDLDVDGQQFRVSWL